MEQEPDGIPHKRPIVPMPLKAPLLNEKPASLSPVSEFLKRLIKPRTDFEKMKGVEEERDGIPHKRPIVPMPLTASLLNEKPASLSPVS